MIKKLGVLIFILLISSFVLAEDKIDSDITSLEKDAEEIENIIDTYAPINEDGDINLSGYKPIKSKAEEKIDKVNLWLEKNASWLKAVFGMVPAITLMFIINFYFVIFFLTNLVLNANTTLGLIPGLDKKIDVLPLEITLAHLLGLVLFIITLVTKVPVMIAKIISEQLSYHWHKTWEVAAPLSIIILIVSIVLFVVLIKFFPQFFLMLKTIKTKAKEKTQATKESLNRKVLETIIEKSTKGQ